jgi:hypothetical protein
MAEPWYAEGAKQYHAHEYAIQVLKRHAESLNHEALWKAIRFLRNEQI